MTDRERSLREAAEKYRETTSGSYSNYEAFLAGANHERDRALDERDRLKRELAELRDKLPLHDYSKELAKQLTAERERVQGLADVLKWYAERGPVWSLHSRSMEPTFSENEANRAREALAKYKGAKE